MSSSGEVPVQGRVPASARIDAGVLAQLLDRVTDGFVALDRDWRYTYVNRTAALILGRSAEQLLGANAWAVFPEAVGSAFHRAQQRALECQQPAFVEAYLPAWDRWFENRIYPSATGLSVFFTDVTARKRIEGERDGLLTAERGARAEADAALARLRAIETVSSAALGHLALDAMLTELLKRVRRVLAVDSATVLLVDAESQVLFPRALDGVALPDLMGSPIVGQGNLAARVAATGQTSIAGDDRAAAPGASPKAPEAVGEPPQAMLAAPLRVGGRVVGVIGVASLSPRRFSEEDSNLLRLVADRVAPTVELTRMVEEARADQERLAKLSRRLVEVQEEERAAIARELHDEVGQLLTGLSLLIEVGGRGSLGHPTEARRIVAELMSRVRSLSLSLRPPMLDELGLVPALRWHLEHFEAQTGIHVTFHTSGVERRFPPGLELSVFRVVQEGLTNAARHAGVSQVELRVWADAQLLRATLDDAGRGFDVEAALAGPSSGLSGMRERARLLGGRLTIESSDGQGTRLQLELPLPALATRPQ